MSYLEEIRQIQSDLLEFLDDEPNNEENFIKLSASFEYYNINDTQNKLKLILRLISKISNNYNRKKDFFDKIDRVLTHFKDKIKEYFSNFEIFRIFKSNKRILLFLIEQGIMTIDKYIITIITKQKYVDSKYPQYFQPEIKPFITSEFIEKYHQKNKINNSEKQQVNNNDNNWIEDIEKELPDHFYEKRKIGENDDYLCGLIREDLVKEFISHVYKTNLPLDTFIKTSIYETNSFLLRKDKISLIEYAAFFGAIQIFQYLRINEVTLTQKLWLFTIHGKNAEMIHLLEDKDILPEDKTYKTCFKQSIIYHHNDVANYFQNNCLQTDEENTYETFIKSIKNYNFAFIQNEFINNSAFNELCKYDYYILVEILLNNANIDLNMLVISIVI
ncbi:hypothetical protein M9Y10_033805 [Tritrichomonas musculus]|uniref:DUF3447 domain-containing protein n=1 Tax=Tritrichomonas musculus TaxID=1915356 RepID=A0ABR2KDU6_9EUKA